MPCRSSTTLKVSSRVNSSAPSTFKLMGGIVYSPTAAGRRTTFHETLREIVRRLLDHSWETETLGPTTPSTLRPSTRGTPASSAA